MLQYENRHSTSVVEKVFAKLQCCNMKTRHGMSVVENVFVKSQCCIMNVLTAIGSITQRENSELVHISSRCYDISKPCDI